MADSLDRIESDYGGYEKFLKAYKTYGIHVQSDNSILCQEWAPGAIQLYLTGEFSNVTLVLLSYHL